MAHGDDQPGYWIGVELGVGRIRATVYSAAFGARGTAKHSTKAQRGAEAVMARAARCVRDAADEADLPLGSIRGVGVAVPGTVEADTGRVTSAPGLGWRLTSLKEALEGLLGLPVFVENEGAAAALAAQAVEFDSKPRRLLGLFAGASVSGGWIEDGQPRDRGEIAHMMVASDGPRCCCGAVGCLDAVAGFPAILAQVAAAARDGGRTMLTDLVGANLKDARKGDLRKAFRAGDRLVISALEDAAGFLGLAAARLIAKLRPDLLVLGGALAEVMGERLKAIVEQVLKNRLPAGTGGEVTLAVSALGDDAAVIGAAVLAARQGTAKPALLTGS